MNWHRRIEGRYQRHTIASAAAEGARHMAFVRELLDRVPQATLDHMMATRRTPPGPTRGDARPGERIELVDVGTCFVNSKGELERVEVCG